MGTPSDSPAATDSGDYEDYDTSSKLYDSTRVPLGLDILAGVALRTAHTCSTPVDKLSVLDVGAGTGSYSVALADRSVGGSYVLCEYNAGMREVCESKVAARSASDATTFSVIPGDLSKLGDAVQERGFHMVLNNQVLQHVSAEASQAFIRSAYEMLAPGGVLCINTCDAHQVADGWWWTALIPKAVAKQVERFPGVPSLRKWALDAGFGRVDVVVPASEVLQGEHYYDVKGPFSEAFRSCDSMWTDAPSEEVDACLAELGRMQESGEFAEWFAAREAQRLRIGQTSFVIAVKGSE